VPDIKMEKKTLFERYKDDILTDNTALDKYRQCKNCVFRDDGTIYANHYQKASCAMYPYPLFKPNEVAMYKETCRYKREG
jgi:hypothetical protein